MRHFTRRTFALTALMGALLLAGCGGSGGGSPATPSPFITRATEKGFSQDALILASDSATTERIPTTLAASIDQDLKRIREKYTNLADLHTRVPSDLRSIIVTVAFDAPYLAKWRAGVLVTGDASLDALLREFNADQISTVPFSGNRTFTLHFADPLNTTILAQRFSGASSTIHEAFPNNTVGDGNLIRRSVTGDALTYTFSKGTGDCPAGCTNWHNFKVTLNPNGDTSVEESDSPPTQSL